MNVIDIGILVIIGMSVIYGFYHGFIQTVGSLLAALLAIGAAFIFGPKMAAFLTNSTGISGLLSTYTDAVVRVKDLVLASSPVSGISQATVTSVLQSVSLPPALAEVLQQNLLTQAFSGTGVNTVGGYVSGTIIAASVQVLCYLLCFMAAYMVLTALLSLVRHVMQFPILKQLDWLAGGVFGLARGVLFVYLLLLLVPLVATVVPVDVVSQAIEQSRFAYLFSSDGFFVRVISQS